MVFFFYIYSYLNSSQSGLNWPWNITSKQDRTGWNSCYLWWHFTI